MQSRLCELISFVEHVLHMLKLVHSYFGPGCYMHTSVFFLAGFHISSKVFGPLSLDFLAVPIRNNVGKTQLLTSIRCFGPIPAILAQQKSPAGLISYLRRAAFLKRFF